MQNATAFISKETINRLVERNGKQADTFPSCPARGSLAINKTPACELVFKAEAGDAIGTTLEATQAQDSTGDNGDGWLSECTYWRHVYFDQAPLAITLADGPTYVAQFDDLRDQPDTTSVDGLGDEGFMRISSIYGLDQPVGSYFVRLGDAVLGVALGIVDISDEGVPVLTGDATRQEQILTESRRAGSPAPDDATGAGAVDLRQGSVVGHRLHRGGRGRDAHHGSG